MTLTGLNTRMKQITDDTKFHSEVDDLVKANRTQLIDYRTLENVFKELKDNFKIIVKLLLRFLICFE